jgi:hypothetical protein
MQESTQQSKSSIKLTPALINKTFNKLLAKGSEGRSLRRQIEMPHQTCCYLRWRIKHYNDVRLQTKMKWLEKAGYDLGYTQAYTKADMAAFARFCGLPSQKKSLSLGYEFMLTQWEAREARKQSAKS